MALYLGMDSERQKHHYEAIHGEYEAHYFDRISMRYREQFIYDPLMGGDALEGKTLVDLACGSGFNSLALRRRFPGLCTVGIDISAAACEAYRRNTDALAFAADLTRPLDFEQSFDAALMIGGLHHCIADLHQTLRNIAKLVRPGGTFFMMEPSKDFLLNRARSLWYQKDRYFDAQTEEALSHDEIAALARPYFEPTRIKYFGSFAYFVLLNSMILRVPLALKPYIAPPLMMSERIVGVIPWRRLYACFLAAWRRTDAVVESTARTPSGWP